MPNDVASRPPPLFVGDHPAMDFLNTHAAPNGVEVEWLATGQDLKTWLTMAGRPTPKASDRQWNSMAGDVRALRESFRSFVDRHAGRPLKPTDVSELAKVNALLATDDSYRQVAASIDGQTAPLPPLMWTRHRRPAGLAAAVLLPLADDIGDLVTAMDFSLVRRCEGEGCTLQFLDRTKSHARRWCSMAGCGNRAKAAAHRARHRHDER